MRILEWIILDFWELLLDIDENREIVGDQIKERNDYIWKNNVKYVVNRDFKCKLIVIYERIKLELILYF